MPNERGESDVQSIAESAPIAASIGQSGRVTTSSQKKVQTDALALKSLGEHDH